MYNSGFPTKKESILKKFKNFVMEGCPKSGSQHFVSLYVSQSSSPLMTKYMFIIKTFIPNTTETVV